MTAPPTKADHFHIWLPMPSTIAYSISRYFMLGELVGRGFRSRPQAYTLDRWAARTWPPTEAALLCLLRVEHRLLGLRAFDQDVDPPDHSFIGDPRRNVAVMLDPAFEFDALVTHCIPSPGRPTCRHRPKPGQRPSGLGATVNRRPRQAGAYLEATTAHEAIPPGAKGSATPVCCQSPFNHL